MAVVTVRYSTRPELWERIANLSSQLWPEYNLHTEVTNRYWGRLCNDFPDFQFVLYDDERDEVLAGGHTLPCAWEGTAAGLGAGIDHIITAGFALHEAGDTPNRTLGDGGRGAPGAPGAGTDNPPTQGNGQPGCLGGPRVPRGPGAAPAGRSATR